MQSLQFLTQKKNSEINYDRLIISKLVVYCIHWLQLDLNVSIGDRKFKPIIVNEQEQPVGSNRGFEIVVTRLVREQMFWRENVFKFSVVVWGKIDKKIWR